MSLDFTVVTLSGWGMHAAAILITSCLAGGDGGSLGSVGGSKTASETASGTSSDPMSKTAISCDAAGTQNAQAKITAQAKEEGR